MVEINRLSCNITVNEDIIRKAAEMTPASPACRDACGAGREKFCHKDWEVSILLTNDEEIRKLNKQYRRVDSPTDVLAFSMREGVDSDLNPHILGDIVISVQTAQRQAIEFGHSLDMELALLTVHGMLHLLGYDHEIDSEAAIMRDKEGMILRYLFQNLPDFYTSADL